jgi:methylphosphotriester-DNA--protein-cysteine methyltransferase
VVARAGLRAVVRADTVVVPGFTPTSRAIPDPVLETTSASVDEIATRCGFGTTASLRAHFRRHVATTPTAYRSAFAARS